MRIQQRLFQCNVDIYKVSMFNLSSELIFHRTFLYIFIFLVILILTTHTRSAGLIFEHIFNKVLDMYHSGLL